MHGNEKLKEKIVEGRQKYTKQIAANSFQYSLSLENQVDDKPEKSTMQKPDNPANKNPKRAARSKRQHHSSDKD